MFVWSLFISVVVLVVTSIFWFIMVLIGCVMLVARRESIKYSKENRLVSGGMSHLS